MKYSITRALAELKLLDSRIKKNTDSLVSANNKLKRTKDIHGTSVEDFKSEGLSKLESIKDLIKRKADIKSKIVGITRKLKNYKEWK